MDSGQVPEGVVEQSVRKGLKLHGIIYMLIELGFLRNFNNMNLHSFPRVRITASKTFCFNSFLSVFLLKRFSFVLALLLHF